MTVTDRRAENDITPLFRTTIMRNNITVWLIESASGHLYNTVVFEGKVTSCTRENGEVCPGFAARHTCHHATLAMQREDARKPVSTDTKGHLHSASGRPFSLLK